MRGLNKFIHSEHPSYMNKLICFVKRVYKQNNKSNPIVLQWSRQNLTVAWPLKNLFFQNIYLRSFCIHCVILVFININQVTILKKIFIKLSLKWWNYPSEQNKMKDHDVYPSQQIFQIEAALYFQVLIMYIFFYYFHLLIFISCLRRYAHTPIYIYLYIYIISLSTFIFIIYVFLAILILFFVFRTLTIRVFGSYCFVIR